MELIGFLNGFITDRVIFGILEKIFRSNLDIILKRQAKFLNCITEVLFLERLTLKNLI